MIELNEDTAVTMGSIVVEGEEVYLVMYDVVGYNGLSVTRYVNRGVRYYTLEEVTAVLLEERSLQATMEWLND